MVEMNTSSKEITTEDALNDKKEIYTPQQYFDAIKGKRNSISNEELQQIYDNGLRLANKYKTTGQIRGLRKIIFVLETIEKEMILNEKGINTFVYKDDIDFFIDKITSLKEYKNRPVKLIELSRYEREVPDEIVEVVDQVKDIFDEFYVIYTDYTGKTERQIKAEEKQRDPILFGVFIDRDKAVCVDRFYYLGDWIDEYCDLTLDKFISLSADRGRYVKHTISSPVTLEELKDYANTFELAENSVTHFVKKPDIKETKKSLFDKVKTFLGADKK